MSQAEGAAVQRRAWRGSEDSSGSSGLWFQVKSLTHQLWEDRKDPLGAQWHRVTMTCVGIPIMTLIVFFTWAVPVGWGGDRV